jgi:hypothetical protein
MPRRSQPSYPSACHPSTHLSRTRSAGVRKREQGRLDAIAASSGKKVVERPRRIDAGRQIVGNMDPSVGFPPLYIHYMVFGKRRAWCLVSAPPTWTNQTLIGAQGPPIILCGSNKSRKEEGEASHGHRV